MALRSEECEPAAYCSRDSRDGTGPRIWASLSRLTTVRSSRAFTLGLVASIVDERASATGLFGGRPSKELFRVSLHHRSRINARLESFAAPMAYSNKNGYEGGTIRYAISKLANLCSLDVECSNSKGGRSMQGWEGESAHISLEIMPTD